MTCRINRSVTIPIDIFLTRRTQERKHEWENWQKTHMVPATLVLICVLSSSSSLARPKSEIFGFSFLSRRTFVALMSLWTIFNDDSSCRKAKPFAIPMQIFCLVGQSILSRCSSGPAFWCELNIYIDFSFWTLSLITKEQYLFLFILAYVLFDVKLKQWTRILDYQIKHGQGYCSPSTHTPVAVDFPQHNIRIVWRDLGAVSQRSYLSHLQTHGSLALIWMKAA